MEYSTNASSISFSDAWEPFQLKDISEFTEVPVTLVSVAMVCIFILHILASTCILKIMLVKKLSARLIMEGFHAFIAPPLQFDWELFYETSQQKNNVLNCWRRYVTQPQILAICIRFFSKVKIYYCCTCTFDNHGASDFLHSHSYAEKINLQGKTQYTFDLWTAQIMRYLSAQYNASTHISSHRGRKNF